ncbi:MAG: D-alanyl-D-alanine carboxypeptidase [Candidatus Sungbacteria bacterium]|uniref:D-alanyl-D-alanine carboxypeptidase n=1 Tax=Candidatus Sungiibacteriota bacterium TaxID=2750080 RepID=A0A933DTU2_9BACT|nr:D-alanyl-D-alanine carboxypeptidase [Candidatus Sungbacteria bacterium]
MSWLRPAILSIALGAVLVGMGWFATKPTLQAEPSAPPAPRLIRRDEKPLEVTAEAVFITRLRTGEVLYQKNADVRLPIASLTKLMTALVLAEESEPLREVVFSAAAKGVGDADSKRSAAAAGERFRAEDVEKMLLISSDNDAAYAVAEHVALARRAELAEFKERINFFVGLMNERVRALGMADTHFANPAGFDDAANYSTAADIVRLVAAITAERPELWTFSRMSETFIFSISGGRYELVNTNPLLYEYPALYGSKTGYEDEAKGALLILYQLSRGELFAIVLLRSSDRFGDGSSSIRWLEGNFVIGSP